MSSQGLKPMSWRDIPRPRDFSGYRCDVNWKFVEEWMADIEGYNGLDINPDFQRGHVWSEAQQVAYIEFRLQGGTSGNDLFWNCASWQRTLPNREDRMVLVDGLQRLTAVLRFMKDEFTVLGGYRKSDFQGKMGLASYSFSMNVNELPTRAQVLDWYLLLNDGGVIHTQEELDRVRELLKAEPANG